MVISRRLAFSVAAVTLLSGIMAAPVAAADPWQRSIRIRNDLPITIYPVISAVRNQNGPQCGSDSLLYRIIVNAGKKGAGIPTGQTVTVQLPKATPCWYNAVRLYLFSVDLATYETRISPDEQTVADGIQWNPPICPNDACWTGTAKTQYQIDAPAQLTEYTINSIDPATGMPFQNGNDTRGIPVVDLDLSFVDSVYLPVAIGLDDGGATQYMGTALSYGDFNRQAKAFLAINDSNGRPLWSEFAAYSPVNWPNNLFNDLGSQRTDQVEGGYNLVNSVLTSAPTPSYMPTYRGPAACTSPKNEICMKSGLVGICCPAPSANGPVFLNCCAVQPYLIDNTTKINATVANPNGTASNPSVDVFVEGWTNWITGNPCSDIGKIKTWPSNQPAFNKQAFCDTFRATVQFLWQSFTPACHLVPAGPAKNQCIVNSIIGYASNEKAGQLPESVQAVQRSVPWGDPSKGQLQYSFDKFLLFWAPYTSIFNLNPYTRFVHNPDDGLDAPGAYSFSIDDLFGNLQSAGSGFIIDVGGKAALPNQEAYDPYEQYAAAFAAGWDHAGVCGRRAIFPTGKPGSSPISFWSNGLPQTPCEIVFYKTAAESGTNAQFAKYQITETSKTVTDTYTGLTQTVTELVYDKAYCEANSTPALVAPPVAVCTNTNTAPNFTGTAAYVSLSDADKPKITLNVPAPIVP